jgi:uncharacterized membrane protein
LYFWDDSARVRSEFRSFVFLLVFVAVVLILGEQRGLRSLIAHIDNVSACLSLLHIFIFRAM